MTNYLIRKKGQKKVKLYKSPTVVKMGRKCIGFQAGDEFFQPDEYNQAWRCINGFQFTPSRSVA